MSAGVPPKKNAIYTFAIGLVSQADTKLLQNNPTLAAGDVLVSIDFGATANLATLPAVTPASSDIVKVTLSAAEMNGDDIMVVFSDAAGAEWADLFIHIKPSTRQVDDLLNKVAAVTLPGQEAPPLTPTDEQMLGWLYKVLRNRKSQTSTLWSLFADDESTVDAKAVVFKDGSTVRKEEIVSGP